MASSEVEIVSDSTTESETADDDDDDVFTASAYGDMEKLRMLVEQDGAFLSLTDSRNGAYPLHLAANNNHPEIVQYIIEHGGDVNAVDDSQQTALHWAAQKGWILVADVLLQNGALVEAADVDGSTAVHIAAQYGQTSFLNHIVAKNNADFDVPDNDGRSPLHWAAYKNFPETVQYIIEHGGDVNLVGNSQQTALHCAAVEGSISVADVLLQNGALVEAADVCGNRAVHFAAQNGQTSFLHHIVVKHNADFDVPDNDGWSPLHWAASQGLVDTVKWLLSKDASQKRQDKDGRTPLHLAAIKGETEVCEVLIDSGTKQEIWLKDNEGNTPIQLAFATSRPHGAFLLSKGLRAECKHLEKLNLKRKALQKGTNRPVIIAMQGHAYTGKSVLAMQLASMLKFPIISLDDFLDATEPTDKQDTLISHTFNLIAQTIKRQIFLGFSVIVDSPLSRLSHLKKLVALVSTKNTPNTRLLIIECKPENEYAYQLRFEEGGSDIYAKHWYKPAGEWPLPKLPRDYTDDDIPPGVSKLVVDTTDSYSPCRLLQAVLDITSCGYGHITKYGAPWCFIHLDKSEQFTCPHCNTYSKSHGTADETLHIFTLYEGVDHCDKLCGVCDNQVLGSCFTCQHCPLILHESCAELAHGDRKHFLPESFPIIMSADPHLRYAFPVEHPCAECRKDGNDFSSKCMNCLFESHLKSRLLPTVVRHKAEPGRIFTLCLNSNVANHMYSYMCLACKTYGVFAAYVLDAYGSPNTYHPECFLLPPSIHHTHGGHTHDLEMVTRREEEMEDYICDCCLNKMDPTAWYYYCSKCIVSVHLKCAFKDFDSGEWVTEA